ncbi:hypothetical protein, partial [Pectinatus cerevisiiphilus]|uniref:hypothetical protein n=1 Tax=Pectinatus cerevisiiphilus TaxID=86956 RepID=UPI001A9CDD24
VNNFFSWSFLLAALLSAGIIISNLSLIVNPFSYFFIPFSLFFSIYYSSTPFAYSQKHCVSRSLPSPRSTLPI